MAHCWSAADPAVCEVKRDGGMQEILDTRSKIHWIHWKMRSGVLKVTEAHVHGGADAGDVDGWSMARLDVGGARGEWDCGVLLICDWI